MSIEWTEKVEHYTDVSSNFNDAGAAGGAIIGKTILVLALKWYRNKKK